MCKSLCILCLCIGVLQAAPVPKSMDGKRVVEEDLVGTWIWIPNGVTVQITFFDDGNYSAYWGTSLYCEGRYWIEDNYLHLRETYYPYIKEDTWEIPGIDPNRFTKMNYSAQLTKINKDRMISGGAFIGELMR